LVFIGAKMAFLEYALGAPVPTEISLLIVLGLILGSIILSLAKPAKPPKLEV
jgi:hypothetical protein